MVGLKKDIRKEILAIRESMEEQAWREKSRRIIGTLTGHPRFLSAEHILCYVNYRREVETTAFLEYCLRIGKAVYCPKVKGTEMEFYRIFAMEELEPGFHGILEPPPEEGNLFLPEGKEGNTLIVMPGAVYDRHRHRIGYGGGYYDRYMGKIPGVFSIAPAFSFQVRDEIPYETHDIHPHVILTEEGEV